MNEYQKTVGQIVFGMMSVSAITGCSEQSPEQTAAVERVIIEEVKPVADEDAGNHAGDDEAMGNHLASGKKDHGGGHQHESWQSPPSKYASLVWNKWDSQSIANNGKRLYEQQCVVCHGSSGKGDGPAAPTLVHPPADLTNNYHDSPGMGDGYLYWRVSEGGTAEPFKSMQSAMPAFAGVLSNAERWSVLTYVHQEFHGGFTDSPAGHDAATHSQHE